MQLRLTMFGDIPPFATVLRLLFVTQNRSKKFISFVAYNRKVTTACCKVITLLRSCFTIEAVEALDFADKLAHLVFLPASPAVFLPELSKRS